MLNLELENLHLKDKISEYEKTLFFKFFKEYGDAGKFTRKKWILIYLAKTNLIKPSDAVNLFNKLQEDVVSLGKVPNISEEEFLSEILPKYTDDKGLVSWISFRKSLSAFEWRPLEYHEVKPKIDKIYLAVSLPFWTKSKHL